MKFLKKLLMVVMLFSPGWVVFAADPRMSVTGDKFKSEQVTEYDDDGQEFDETVNKELISFTTKYQITEVDMVGAGMIGDDFDIDDLTGITDNIRIAGTEIAGDNIDGIFRLKTWLDSGHHDIGLNRNVRFRSDLILENLAAAQAFGTDLQQTTVSQKGTFDITQTGYWGEDYDEPMQLGYVVPGLTADTVSIEYHIVPYP